MNKETFDFAINNVIASFMIDDIFISTSTIEKVKEKYEINGKILVKEVDEKNDKRRK